MLVTYLRSDLKQAQYIQFHRILNSQVWDRSFGRTFLIASSLLHFSVFILVLQFHSLRMSYFFGLFNPIPFDVAGVVRRARISSSHPPPCLEDQGEFRAGPKIKNTEGVDVLDRLPYAFKRNASLSLSLFLLASSS